jgi:anti-sigma factor RsiW
MRSCVRFAPMIGSREGELPEEEARALARHLDGCPSCRALEAELAATHGLLADALMAQANSRDFAPFVDQVMARVGEAGWSAQQRGGRRQGSILSFLRNHWRLAAATVVVVAVLAAASSFLYVQRHVEQPEELAALEISVEGGYTVLQTSDGPVVLIDDDDWTGG